MYSFSFLEFLKKYLSNKNLPDVYHEKESYISSTIKSDISINKLVGDVFCVRGSFLFKNDTSLIKKAEKKPDCLQLIGYNSSENLGFPYSDLLITFGKSNKGYLFKKDQKYHFLFISIPKKYLKNIGKGSLLVKLEDLVQNNGKLSFESVAEINNVFSGNQNNGLVKIQKSVLQVIHILEYEVFSDDLAKYLKENMDTFLTSSIYKSQSLFDVIKEKTAIDKLSINSFFSKELLEHVFKKYFNSTSEAFLTKCKVRKFKEFIKKDVDSFFDDCVVYHRLPIKRMLERFGLDENELNQIYFSKKGLSIQESFEVYKHEYGKNLILNSGLPASRISKRLGFSSLNKFSQNFKKKENFTPSQYHKLSKKAQYDEV